MDIVASYFVYIVNCCEINKWDSYDFAAIYSSTQFTGTYRRTEFVLLKYGVNRQDKLHYKLRCSCRVNVMFVQAPK
jgi:hypothetical protein